MSRNRMLVPILCLVGFASALAMSQSESRQYRVVMQVTADAPAEWESILGNVENLREAIGADNVEIEVVAHGKGIGLVLQSNQAMAERMGKLATDGVVFAACQNTMRKKNLTEKDLLPFVTTVDSGVAHVVRRQAEGWSYIRYGE